MALFGKSEKDPRGQTPPEDKYTTATLIVDLHAAMGEFIGTIFFLLFGMGAVQATVINLAQNTATEGTAIQGSDAARLSGVLFISLGFGFSLFAIASIFYRFTGSIFNPQVSLALCLVGAINPIRCAMTIVAQLVASIVASAILLGLTPGDLSVNCTLGYEMSRTQGLFMEMFTTATLCLAVLMLAAEKSKMTPFAPVFLGITLFIVELFSVEFSGGAVNTARAFGPAVISGFMPYHWIYWVGPTLGAFLAVGLFYFMKWIKYWEISPGQDSTNHMDGPTGDVREHDEMERTRVDSSEA